MLEQFTITILLKRSRDCLLAHSWFKSSELVTIFYYRDKTRVHTFYFLNKTYTYEYWANGLSLLFLPLELRELEYLILPKPISWSVRTPENIGCVYRHWYQSACTYKCMNCCNYMPVKHHLIIIFIERKSYW